MGFAGTEVRRALAKLPEAAACQDSQSRLKAALELLVPRAARSRVDSSDANVWRSADNAPDQRTRV
jgi:hypothetical protein